MPAAAGWRSHAARNAQGDGAGCASSFRGVVTDGDARSVAAARRRRTRFAFLLDAMSRILQATVARAATRCCSSARQDCTRGTASPTAGGGVRQALWIAVFGGATVAALPRAVLREPSRGLPRRRRWGCPQGVRGSGSFIRCGESCRGSYDSQVARRHAPRSAMSPTRAISSSPLAHSMIQSPVSPRNGRRDSHERDRTVAGTSGSAGTVGRGDSHAASYRDDRKAAPVGPEPVGAGTSVRGGGVRPVVMDRGVRRRDARRVAAGRVAAERRTRVSLRVSPDNGSNAPQGSLPAQPPEPSVIASPSETPEGWWKRQEPSGALPRRQRWR